MDLPNVPDEHDMDRQIIDQDARYRRVVRLLLTGMGVGMLLLIGAVIWLSVVVAGNTSRNEHQIAANQIASDQRWCATFDLLTSPPVPPPANAAANPSREANYLLYSDFVTLERQFGCRP